MAFRVTDTVWVAKQKLLTTPVLKVYAAKLRQFAFSYNEYADYFRLL